MRQWPSRPSPGPSVELRSGLSKIQELRMTRMVACFAMGMDALLTWDDVFDSRQKRHESGIREHSLLQAGSPSVVVRKVLQAREIQVDNCGSFEGVLDFLRLLGQHVKRTTGAARHGLGSRSNVAGQPMGDRFVKVAQKGNGEDGLRVPVATDLNKGFMDICEHQRIVQRPCPGRASSKALVIFGRHSTGCSSDNAVSVALSTSEKSVCTSKRKAGNACSGRKTMADRAIRVFLGDRMSDRYARS